MENIFLFPKSSLTHLVNNILVSRWFPGTGIRHDFSFPPLPEQFIIFYPFDLPVLCDPFSGQQRKAYRCTVVGPQTSRFFLQPGLQHFAVKIGLQPGVLHRITGIPLKEMIQQKDLDGEQLFGQPAKDALEALAVAKSMDQVKGIAEDFIVQVSRKVLSEKPVDKVFSVVLQSGGLVSIDKLVSQACTSNRQFSRLFETRMGLSPKFFCRLVRFSNAWLIKEMNADLTWTAIAHHCGYFDQMHLIRDFKSFTQTNPKEIAEAFARQPFSLDNRVFV